MAQVAVLVVVSLPQVIGCKFLASSKMAARCNLDSSCMVPKRGNFLQRESDEEEPVPDHRHRVRVLIGRENYRELRGHLLELATHRTAERLRSEFWNVPYEPYAPVRKQLLRLLRQVNAKRLAMGYERVSADALRLRRRIFKPFDGKQTFEVPSAAPRLDPRLPIGPPNTLTFARVPIPKDL